jgi:cell division protein FtsB
VAALKNARAGLVTLLIVAALSLYALANLAATKAEAAEYEAYRDELLAEAGALESENARLAAQAASDTEEETTERLARERLGLVSPGGGTEGSNQQLNTGG